MFWRRRKNKSTDENNKEGLIELPPLEKLEKWVLTLIIKLGLKPGTFTFLPAYGGVLLFIRNEGLSWIPYGEIQDALGQIDSSKIVENTAIASGGAGAAVLAKTAIISYPITLPVILIPKLIKGSYRVIAHPSPNSSMSILNSMIEKVIIEEKQLKKGLLNTFSKVPLKDEEKILSTYVVTIKRKFLDYKETNFAIKFKKNLVEFLSGTKEPIFAVPSEESNIIQFATILKEHDIEVSLIIQKSEKASTSGNITTNEIQ